MGLGLGLGLDENKKMGEMERPKVIRLLSCVMERVAETNDGRHGHGHGLQKMTAFDGVSRPSISIHSYLDRIFKYANCSPSCYIVAYVYLHRFTRRHPSSPITSLNVHRLLITTIMLSAKFMDDMYYNNSYYAKVGGITTTEMNFLEVDFLFGLGFHLNVTPSTFQTCCSYLHSQMMLLQLPHLNLSLQPSSNLFFHYFCEEEDDDSSQQLAV